MDLEALFWKCIIYCVVGVIILGTGLGAYSLFRCIQADGQVSYCFVEYYSPPEMPPVIRLKGFRPWRADRPIGTYSTLEEATKAADLIGCKIEKK